MSFELFVAVRYLLARRKQTVLSFVTLIAILGVTAGVAALNVALALSNGFHEEFQTRILGATAHVNLLSVEAPHISDFESVFERTKAVDGVTSVAPTVYGQSMLVSGLRQHPAVLKGIDPERAEILSDGIAIIVEGDLSEFRRKREEPLIVLGRELAHSLGTFAGDHIRALGLEGELSPLGRMPRWRTFRVAAVFESGLWEYDANWALISIPSAQHFFGLGPKEISALEYRIEDIYLAQETAERIRAAAGPRFMTSTWIELNRPLFAALRLEKLAMFVAIGLIVLVASLNIVSTLTLMVMEKNRDIAVLSAMGGTPRMVNKIFVLQGLVIGAVGTAAGSLLGVASTWYLDRYKIFRLEPEVYSIPYVPFRLDYGDLLLIAVTAVLISFLATLYPARSASRVDPVEALRYE